jgi:hypothetical protein
MLETKVLSARLATGPTLGATDHWEVPGLGWVPQTQFAVFLASEGTEIIHPEPKRFFEAPVVLPLPDAFGFIP